MSFVIVPLAGPSGGKTELLRPLEEKFEEAGCSVLILNNKDPSVHRLRKFLQDAERSRKREKSPSGTQSIPFIRSLLFQAIFLELWHKAETAHEDVVIFEHDQNYTWAIESFGSQVPDYALEHYIGWPSQQNYCVIYLYNEPAELRKRSATRMLWDADCITRVCEGLEAMRRTTGRTEDWIIAPPGTPEEIVAACFPEVFSRYEEYRKLKMKSKEKSILSARS